MRLSTRKETRATTLFVEVTQVEREPLDWLKERWGGFIGGRRRGVGRQRPHFRWKVSAKLALRFLCDIRPFIVRPIVMDRIEVARQFQVQKKSTWANRTDEYAERQTMFIQQMKQLHVRGLSPVLRAKL